MHTSPGANVLTLQLQCLEDWNRNHVYPAQSSLVGQLWLNCEGDWLLLHWVDGSIYCRAIHTVSFQASMSGIELDWVT